MKHLSVLCAALMAGCLPFPKSPRGKDADGPPLEEEIPHKPQGRKPPASGILGRG